MRLLFSFAITVFLTSAVAAESPPIRPDTNGPELRGQWNNAPAAADGDIMALAFVVMMEAAKSAQEDLRAIMASVKAANEAKRKQRELLAEMQAAQAGCAGRAAAAWRVCVGDIQKKLVRVDLAALDVMKGAARQSSNDLRAMMTALQSASQARVRGDAAPARRLPPNPCDGWNLSMFKTCLATINARLTGNLPDRESEGLAKAGVEQIRQSLDTMSEAGEIESLRLQMAMDRMAKMIETLSNILTKISETQSAIAQNLK